MSGGIVALRPDAESQVGTVPLPAPRREVLRIGCGRRTITDLDEQVNLAAAGHQRSYLVFVQGLGARGGHRVLSAGDEHAKALRLLGRSNVERSRKGVTGFDTASLAVRPDPHSRSRADVADDGNDSEGAAVVGFFQQPHIEHADPRPLLRMVGFPCGIGLGLRGHGLGLRRSQCAERDDGPGHDDQQRDPIDGRRSEPLGRPDGDESCCARARLDDSSAAATQRAGDGDQGRPRGPRQGTKGKGTEPDPANGSNARFGGAHEGTGR